MGLPAHVWAALLRWSWSWRSGAEHTADEDEIEDGRKSSASDDDRERSKLKGKQKVVDDGTPPRRQQDPGPSNSRDFQAYTVSEAASPTAPHHQDPTNVEGPETPPPAPSRSESPKRSPERPPDCDPPPRREKRRKLTREPWPGLIPNIPEGADVYFDTCVGLHYIHRRCCTAEQREFIANLLAREPKLVRWTSAIRAESHDAIPEKELRNELYQDVEMMLTVDETHPDPERELALLGSKMMVGLLDRRDASAYVQVAAAAAAAAAAGAAAAGAPAAADAAAAAEIAEIAEPKPKRDCYLLTADMPFWAAMNGIVLFKQKGSTDLLRAYDAKKVREKVAAKTRRRFVPVVLLNVTKATEAKKK